MLATIFLSASTVSRDMDVAAAGGFDTVPFMACSKSEIVSLKELTLAICSSFGSPHCSCNAFCKWINASWVRCSVARPKAVATAHYRVGGGRPDAHGSRPQGGEAPREFGRCAAGCGGPNVLYYTPS